MESVEFILPVVQTHEPSWGKVSTETCKIIRQVSTSSRVFVVETSLPIQPKRFIYKVFGSSDTLNLSQCSSIMRRLAKSKLAPTIYIETESYRLEEFLENFRNLTRTEIVRPHIACKIANKLREMHEIDMSDILDVQSIVCVVNATKWRKVAQRVFTDYSQFLRKNECKQAARALGKEYLQMFYDVLPKESPVVLAHMDTCFLNVLYQEEKDEVYLLDFDYTGYCYRGFDLAMLLTDVKYDYNYPEFPFYEYQAEAYPGDQVLASCIKAYGEGIDMFVECKRCMIASNYLWAMWSFSLFKEENKGFDVLSYGLLRFKEFLEGYEEFKNEGTEGIKRQGIQYFE